jgi:hypothetical protein
VHDGQGRVIEAHDRGRLDLEDDKSVKLVTYADNEELWRSRGALSWLLCP